MTSQTVKSYLTADPFFPIRLHLASGKTVDIAHEGIGYVLQNSILVLHPVQPRSVELGRWEEIALRLIERIERLDPQNTL